MTGVDAGVVSDDLQGCSIWDVRDRAQQRVPEEWWRYLDSGAADGLSSSQSHQALSALRLVPRVFRDVSAIDTSVELLGTVHPHPLVLGPTGCHRLFHPDGELATATGAERSGAPLIVSMYTTSALDEIAARNTQWWLQINPTPEVEFNKALIGQAEALGAKAVVVTVDTVVPGPRERQRWNGLDLPDGLAFGILRHYPVDIRPTGGLRNIYRPSLDAAFTLDKLGALVRSTTLPVLVKGVLHPSDACAAIAAGAQGVIVSNHGGRNLDTAVAPVDVLAQIVDAVDGTAPVLYDGGVRRGTDVLKALAIGAGAVLIGRPYLWGLAAAGSAGVQYVVAKILNELMSAMALTGSPSVRDLSRDLILQYSGERGERRARDGD